jgi:hypothetical protein
VQMSLEFVVCSAIAASIFVCWATTPALGHVGIVAWRLTGLTVAAVFGAAWSLVSRSVAPVSLAVAVGLVFGSAYCVARVDDVHRSWFDYIASGLATFGFEAARFFASSVVGAVAAGYVRRRSRAAS